MKIKDLPADSRPRERVLKFGIENLSNSEILALILEKGSKKENVIEMSSRLIKQYGLDKLSECSLCELQEIEGIGQAKAMQILAIFELNKRCSQEKHPVTKITCANDVYYKFNNLLKDKKEEYFYALLLDTKNNIIGGDSIPISKGILDASIVHPREIFKSAIKNSASKIILIHNHPSGDSSPSNEDLDITEKLMKSGEEIGINILDSIIIGKDNFWSWAEKHL